MSFFAILQAFIPLIIIVALLYGVLLFVKKYGISFKGKKSGSMKINVISTQMIAPKKFISVVKVQDKLLVLGVSDNSINLLKELEGNFEEDIQPEAADENFMTMLKRNMGLK